MSHTVALSLKYWIYSHKLKLLHIPAAILKAAGCFQQYVEIWFG